MPFADVQARTNITGFTAGETATILATLQTAYDGSVIAKAMFDDWIATAGHTIDISNVAGVFQAFAGTGRVEIDLSYISDLSYINDTGTPVLHSLLGALVHELGHALHGTRDTVTATDYQGANVRYINTIWAQLGLDQEISYIAQARPAIHTVGFQYTGGTAIDAAESRDRDWSSAALGASNDLLIGGSSANTLQSGDGNDFLVGAGGNDNLNGGTGRDTAVYLSAPLDYDIRRNPDGTWTVRHARGAATDGTDTLSNMEAVRFLGARQFELQRNGITFQTDFALVIDTTGSMGSSINSVKAQAAMLIDAAFAGGAADARIGVVGFKDTTNGEPSSVILPFTDQDAFADRRAAAIAAINSIGVGGGGDLPETAYDGLRIALDGSMGQWRVGAGILRVALFTDAPAKDGALAATVTALANGIGATITGHASVAGVGGSVDTFNLTLAATGGGAANGLDGSGDPSADPEPTYIPSDDPIVPDTTTNQVQIFTIYTGPSGRDTTALADIAVANGGALLTAPTNDDLVAALLAIITAPAGGTLSIAAAGAARTEGQIGTTAFTFTVTRGGSTAGTDSASWAVTGSGANPAGADDFVGGVLVSGTVDFAAGDVTKTITVAVSGDVIAESDEGFTVTLSAPSTGVTLGTATATGLIVNDDDPRILVLNTTSGTPLVTDAHAYPGPVGLLENEYINLTPDNLNIIVNTNNWFIHSGGGTDAISAFGGFNVLDGGGGSNFLSGAAGVDTFFVDARGATADIWSTLVNFRPGDGATIWGVSAEDFLLVWHEGEGAAGFTGLTLHALAVGQPIVSLTLAGYSQSDVDAGRLLVSSGFDAGSGSRYTHIQGHILSAPPE